MKKTRTTKLIALTLSVLMLMMAAFTTVFADTAASTPAVWDGTSDTSWYDPESTTKTVTLTTPAQLAGLSELSQTQGNNFFEWTIKLGCDMVMNTGNASDWATTAPTNTWTPIGEFWGTFDGQGYTISGLYFSDKAKTEVGLFTALNGGIVKNVSIVNSYFCGYRQVGSVAGIIKGVFGKISNVYSDAILYAYPANGAENGANPADGAQSGGILGANVCALSEITNCWFDGAVYGVAEKVPDHPNGEWACDNKATQLGGIIGVSTNTIKIVDCLVTGHVEGHSQIGGVVGRYTCGGSVMENTLFLGTVTSTRYALQSVFAGEFLGIALGSFQFTLKNCYGLDTYEVTYSSVGSQNNKTAPFSTNGSSTMTADSVIGRFAAADLKGDTAKTKLTTFDFTNTWKAVEDSTPVIAALEYVAANKTSDPDADHGTVDTPDDTPDDTGSQEPADTNPPATTEVPAATTDAPATTEPVKTEKKGCGSAVSASAFACVMTVAALGACFSKKKK